MMKRRKLARLFWCKDGGRAWVTINMRGAYPRGFDQWGQKMIKNPSDSYLARLEGAIPKLIENGYSISRVKPFFHPESEGGWCVI
jgi:hypothetical protein